MFTLPDLPYSYSSLEPFIDEETMRIHHDKHHGTYVNNVNDALKDDGDLLNMDAHELYLNLDKVPEKVRGKVKNNLGGHINHSMFWQIMCPPEMSKMPDLKSDFIAAMKSAFGTQEDFAAKFSESSLSRFGSGWAWLVVENEKLDIVSTANQDNPIMEGKTPILGLDVWEHAYYLKYKNLRADYVKAWWSVVNWNKVEENYLKTKEGDK